MKNIIIIGPSRVGKSTLAAKLCKKYHFDYISGDSIRNAFIHIYPSLGYTVKNVSTKIEFCKFIKWLIQENSIHFKEKIYYVVDTTDITVQDAKNLFQDSLIIGLGSKEAHPKVMLKKIRENDTKLEWTYGYNEERLLEIINETISNSKQLYKACYLNNIPYFDTSIDREKTYNDIMKWIEGKMNE